MRALAALFLVICAGAARAEMALLMVEAPGCVWCARWNAEIGPAYPNTAEGRRAPLRRVDLSDSWPGDLAGIARERVTPTFILVNGATEVGRLRGYPGPDFFWPLLAEMLAKADPR